MLYKLPKYFCPFGSIVSDKILGENSECGSKVSPHRLQRAGGNLLAWARRGFGARGDRGRCSRKVASNFHYFSGYFVCLGVSNLNARTGAWGAEASIRSPIHPLVYIYRSVDSSAMATLIPFMFQG